MVYEDSVGESSMGYSLTLAPLDRILVTGSRHNDTTQYDMVIWCYDASGTLCEDFGDIHPVTGPKGFAVHNGAAGGSGYDLGYSIAIDTTSHRIFVTGDSDNVAGNSDMVIWCYDASGTSCEDFGDIDPVTGP